MSLVSAFRARPPHGVSFAAHSVDAGDDFKREVVAELVSFPWNEYPAPDTTSLCRELAEQIGFTVDPAIVSLHRGAEDALRRLIERLRPVRFWAGADSYPGYRRIAGRANVEFGSYDNGLALPEDLRGHLVAITTPGSPAPLDDTESIVDLVLSRGGNVALDATFELLERKAVRSLEAWLRYPEVALVISTSKSAGLASLRIGLLIGPTRMNADVSMEWDAFQCAALSVLARESNLALRLADVALTQRDLRTRLIHAAKSLAGAPVFDGNAFAVTFRRTDAIMSILKPGMFKDYPHRGLVRVDATAAVCDTIERGVEERLP